MNIPSEAQSAFFVCTFSMLSKLAAADGRITADEVAAVKKYIEGHLRLDRKRAEMALKIFQEAEDSPLSFRDYAEKFKESFPERVQVLDTMIDVLLQVSMADKKLHQSEESLIRSAALLFDLSEARFERLKARFLGKAGEGDKRQAYSVLGVSPDASDDEVVKAYTQLKNELNRESVRQSGVPDDFLEVVGERLEAVEEAFREIKKTRQLGELH